MSVQLLDKTRKINQLLQNSDASKVIFSDICVELAKIFGGHTLVISSKGKVLGAGNSGRKDDASRLLPERVGSFVDSLLNERLLSILSTKENVNLETLGFNRDEEETFQAIVSPICISGDRLGTL